VSAVVQDEHILSHTFSTPYIEYMNFGGLVGKVHWLGGFVGEAKVSGRVQLLHPWSVNVEQ